MSRFVTYLNDTAREMHHVKWPTVRQTVVYSALVIVISIVTAIFIALFDYLFEQFLLTITK